jgi:hypothetical protein
MTIFSGTYPCLASNQAIMNAVCKKKAIQAKLSGRRNDG